VSYATWDDSAYPAAWAAKSTVLEPAALSMGTVASAWTGTGFGLNLPGNGSPLSVDLDFSGAAPPMVYRVDRTGGRVTVTPEDPATAAGQQELAQDLVPGAVVKVFATPGPAGGLLAGAVFIYTGTLPLPLPD
jgi:hypothetical protein